jgi:hypothetical protein
MFCVANRAPEKRASERATAPNAESNYWQDIDVYRPSSLQSGPTQLHTNFDHDINPTLDEDICSWIWDGQFIDPMMQAGLDQLSADDISPMSPPSSSSARTPEEVQAQMGQVRNSATKTADDLGIQQTMSDTAALSFVISPMAINPPLTPATTPEQERDSLRLETARVWKGPKEPNPTWGKNKGEPSEPLLHTAAKKGNCEILQMLLEHDVDISERDEKGCTALHLAIEHQREDAVMWLLKNGVEVNACDQDGRTALSMAVSNGCETGVKLFMLHGADPKFKELPWRQNSICSTS